MYGYCAHVLRWGATEEPGSRDLVMTREQEMAAVGGGLTGGRLPKEWEVVDAELYAIFRALRMAWYESQLTGGARQAPARCAANAMTGT